MRLLLGFGASVCDEMRAAVLDVALRYSAGDADAPGLVP